MLDDNLYLQHILSAIERIEEYSAGLDQEKFLAEPIKQDAIIRQLEIIGEATKQLSQELRAANADIPWSDIAGMRDYLIHAYFGVNLEQVWLTVIDDIPNLKRRVRSLRESEE